MILRAAQRTLRATNVGPDPRVRLGLHTLICTSRNAAASDALPASVSPLPPVGQAASSSLAIQGPHLSALERIKRLPLLLIEEVSPPPAIISEIELIMTAWNEEQARHFLLLTMIVRFCIALCFAAAAYLAYRTMIATERRLRGVENMPRGLRIGSVVYFDIVSEGREAGRIVIGLLTENCPLYCEYFHRRCTGNGGQGDSFRGMRLSALVPRAAAIFGDGRLMTHDVPGYHPNYLPTEYLPQGPWRGALSSIALAPNKESPNFVIHLCGGDYPTQVFGLVLAGFDVAEAMSRVGVRHGCNPNREFIIESCGELCTLDKSNVQPMPWRLYDTVSKGYDNIFFGDSLPFPVMDDHKTTTILDTAPTATTSHTQAKPWWKLW